jgi:hypothetical protein
MNEKPDCSSFAWDRDGGVIHCASLNKSPGAWIEAGVDVVGAMARTGQDD